MHGGATTMRLGLLSLLLAFFATGCFDQRATPLESPQASAAPAAPLDESGLGPFQLKPEWSGPCQRAEKVDVDLGNAPEVMVRALGCQITGKEPSKEVVSEWAEKL